MLIDLLRPRYTRMADDAGSPPDASQPPTPTAPTASTIVAAGPKREGDVAEDLEKKKLQTRIAELEREKQELRASLEPKPEPVAITRKQSWLEGGSFFD